MHRSPTMHIVTCSVMSVQHIMTKRRIQDAEARTAFK